MKKALYLGLDPSRYRTEKRLIHYPIITIEKRPFEEVKSHFQALSDFSAILLTSRTAASLFFEYAEKASIEKSSLVKKLYLAVGSATADMLPHALVAREECGEGIIALVEGLPHLKKHSF